MTELTTVDPPDLPTVRARRSELRPVIMAMLLLTVLAIALGGGIGFLMTVKIEKNLQTKEEKAEVNKWEASAKNYTGDIVLVKLEPVTTNLMAPDTMFVRVESSLVLDRSAASNSSVMSLLAAEIGQDILSFLRTVTLAQLQGPAGLQNLREDLNDRVAIRSEGRVRELIIEAMVIQ